MEKSTLKQIQNTEHKTAIKFINDLITNGIPLSAIMTNDWGSSPSIYVYVTIPYGNKNGGKSKSWKNRFGKRALFSAVNFWKLNKQITK